MNAFNASNVNLIQVTHHIDIWFCFLQDPFYLHFPSEIRRPFSMSASMRDWIGPLVETELKAALASFEGKYFPGQRVEDGRRACGPDKVTVRVKRGQEVQIIEVSSDRTMSSNISNS
jgi:hypothetical protein